METIDIIKSMDYLIAHLDLGFYIVIGAMVFFCVTVGYFTVKFWDFASLIFKEIYRIASIDQTNIILLLGILIMAGLIVTIIVLNSDNIAAFLQ